MNRNLTLILAMLVLLAATAAVAFHLGRQSPALPAAEAGTAVPERDRRATPGGGSGEGLAPTVAAPVRNSREVRNEELVDQYGESRTNLSRHVVSNVVSLLEDAVEMGDMMLSGEGAARFGGRGDWQLRNALRDTGIELDEAQQEQARELFAAFQRRELDRSREAVEGLKDDPTALMGLLLASDARSREELSEEDYAALQQASAEDLRDVINPLDRDNFRGRNPIEDETFRRDFAALLDGDQSAAFDAAMAERESTEAEDSGGGMSDITKIPVMDLESLDSAVGSAKQMTSGFKQVMQGMGNLGPLLEQQRRSRDGQDEE